MERSFYCIKRFGSVGTCICFKSIVKIKFPVRGKNEELVVLIRALDKFRATLEMRVLPLFSFKNMKREL